MSAAAILAELRNQGLRVRMEAGLVKLSPRERVTPEVLARVRANKPAILEALAEEAANTSDAAPPAVVPEPGTAPVVPLRATQERCERLLKAEGEGLHPLKNEPGWRTYNLADGKTTGLYVTLEGLCEVRGWLPRVPEPDPAQPDEAPDLEARRAELVRLLQADPTPRYAFDVQGAPLKPEPGEPVSVMLAVRTAAGIVTGELHVPRDRFDWHLFVVALEAQGRAQ